MASTVGGDSELLVWVVVSAGAVFRDGLVLDQYVIPFKLGVTLDADCVLVQPIDT